MTVAYLAYDEDTGEVFDDEIPEAHRARAHEKPTAETARPAMGGSGDVVAQWPCARCRVPVDVTAAAVESRSAFNRILAARGEPLIAVDEVVACEPCSGAIALENAARADRHRRAVARYVETLKNPNARPCDIAVAEDYLTKRADDGPALVTMLARKRAGVDGATKNTKARGTW